MNLGLFIFFIKFNINIVTTYTLKSVNQEFLGNPLYTRKILKNLVVLKNTKLFNKIIKLFWYPLFFDTSFWCIKEKYKRIVWKRHFSIRLYFYSCYMPSGSEVIGRKKCIPSGYFNYSLQNLICHLVCQNIFQPFPLGW